MGKDMNTTRFRRTSLLTVTLVVATVRWAGCLVAWVAMENTAKAAFPGANGKIVFASDRDGVVLDPLDPLFGKTYDIYTMNADGSGVTRLTNDPARDIQPAWSPDGTKIAFVSIRDGNTEVYVMNADG